MAKKTNDELQAMNIKHLREEANIRGISASGTKKELLERLCCDNDKVSSNVQGKQIFCCCCLLLGMSY